MGISIVAVGLCIEQDARRMITGHYHYDRLCIKIHFTSQIC